MSKVTRNDQRLSGTQRPSGKPVQGPKFNHYLLTIVLLAVPVPLFVVFSGAGAGVLTAMTFAYLLWAPFACLPLGRRAQRKQDASLCTPEREIASWRCDVATLDEYKRGMKRLFPWTWRFKLYVRFRQNSEGYVQFRFFPEGIQIGDYLLHLARTPQLGRLVRTWVGRMVIHRAPACIELHVNTSSGRYRSSRHLFVPFPPSSLADAEKVLDRLNRGSPFAANAET